MNKPTHEHYIQGVCKKCGWKKNTVFHGKEKPPFFWLGHCYKCGTIKFNVTFVIETKLLEVSE